MARLSLLLLAFFAVLVALASSSDEIDSYAEPGFYGSRFRRVPVAYHGENAYLQQLLSNLKPRFRRSL